MTKNLRKRSTTFMATVVAIIISLVVFLPMIAACGDTTEDVGTITLNKTELVLYIGDTETLTATLSKEDAKVTWASSDRNVATVTGGKITAKTAGKTTITASLSDEVKATCEVTVNDVDVALDKSEATIDLEGAANKTMQLTATVSHGTPVWKSSDDTVATVSSTGLVSFAKAKKSTASVTVSVSVGSKSASCTITVNDSTVPTDYAAVEKKTSGANVVAEPGNWFYFLKSAHTSRVEFAPDPIGGDAVPWVANGAYNMAFNKFETVTEPDAEGKDQNTQIEFRYYPTATEVAAAAEGKVSVYKMTFTVLSTRGGEVGVNVNKTYGEDEENDNVILEANEARTVTVEGGMNYVDKWISIRPLMFDTDEEKTPFTFTLSNISFEKTGEVDLPEEETPETPVTDSYTMDRANNDAGAVKFVGKWSYYLQGSASQAGCEVTTHTYDKGTVTVTYKNLTNIATGKTEERIFYMPETGVTSGTITCTVTLSVAGKLVVDGAVSKETVELAANTAQTLTYTFDASTAAIRFVPIVEDAEAAKNVTITFTAISITPNTAA